MPHILLALPHPVLSLMAASLETGKLGSDQPQWNPSGRRDHSDVWLRNAAAGLCLLAAAAAVVSFTAQYRLIYATRHLAVVAGLEAAIPDAAALVFACLGIALALHGRRAIRGPDPEPGLGRHQRVHEHARGRTGLAEPGRVGDAAGRLRPGQRHAHRRRPDRGAHPPAGPGRRDGRGGADAAGRGRRAGVVAAAPGPGAGLHPGRVPRLGGGGVPGSPPAAARPPGPGRPGSPHPAGVAEKVTKTARFLSLVTERHGSFASIPLDRVAGIAATLAPLADLNTGSARAALRKAVLAARNGAPR